MQGKTLLGLVGIIATMVVLLWLNFKTDATYPKVTNPNVEETPAKKVKCSDFASKEDAQTFFDSKGGISSEYKSLDRDGDGLVCES